MHDLLITGGTVVTPGGSEPLDVAIDGERIAALGPGLWPRKGRLEPGADADVVVFDPNRRWTVRWEDLHMVAGDFAFTSEALRAAQPETAA
jgi:dihydroorotase-like cyclic amidohydrolase